MALETVYANSNTGEKPVALEEANDFLLQMFKKVDSTLEGQIQPEESVRKCLEVIELMSAKNSGLLLSHNGDQENWF